MASLVRASSLAFVAAPAVAALLDGYATCYGDYQDQLDKDSVACGYGSFIAGEDFTYTTAICETWAQGVCGSCYAVTCDSGQSANMGCGSSPTTYVRVIDELPAACGSDASSHIFDLSTVPFSAVATENGETATCSGSIYVKYEAVSCSSTAGLVSGGVKIGIMANQADPWCPPFWIANVASAGALYSVEVSSDGGKNWHAYQKNTGNGGRWDCANSDGAGSYLGNSLSFKMELCTLDDLPSSCTASGSILTLVDVLPSDWCANGASPCDSASWQASENFNDTVSALVSTETVFP